MEEKPLVNLEVASQMYTVLPFFVAKTIVDLPLQALMQVVVRADPRRRSYPHHCPRFAAVYVWLAVCVCLRLCVSCRTRLLTT